MSEIERFNPTDPSDVLRFRIAVEKATRLCEQYAEIAALKPQLEDAIKAKAQATKQDAPEREQMMEDWVLVQIRSDGAISSMGNTLWLLTTQIKAAEEELTEWAELFARYGLEPVGSKRLDRGGAA